MANGDPITTMVETVEEIETPDSLTIEEQVEIAAPGSFVYWLKRLLSFKPKRLMSYYLRMVRYAQRSWAKEPKKRNSKRFV